MDGRASGGAHRIRIVCILCSVRTTWPLRSVFACLLLLSGLGCEAGSKVVDTVGGQSRKLFTQMEPTGTLNEIATRTEMWESWRDRAKELNIDKINRVADELSAVLRELAEWIERADLQRAVASVATAVDTVDAQIKVFPADQLERVIEETGVAVVKLTATVSQSGQHLDRLLSKTEAMVDEAGRKIRQLPSEDFQDAMAAIQASASKLPATIDGLNTAIARLQTWILVATIVLVIVALSAAVWLARTVRARALPKS